MDIQQTLFSDPMYQMMQGRSGLAPDQYWSSLHPEAKKQHLSRIGADPTTYLSEQQYGNSQAVGANSGPNALLSNNPVLAGYGGNPVQPGYPGTGPSTEVSPALSSAQDAMIARGAPGALSPMNQGQMPGPGTTDTYVPPANDLTAAALLQKQEGVLNVENIGQRQKLETMIRDLEEGITSAADLPRLEQLKLRLNELGGPTSESVTTPEYSAASEDYTRQLKDAQVMAIEARPTVNVARTEIANLLPLLNDPSAPDEVKANAQARIEEAEAVINQSEAEVNAIRGGGGNGAPVLQPNPNEQAASNNPQAPVLASSNPEQNMANFRPAPGGRQEPVLADASAPIYAEATTTTSTNTPTNTEVGTGGSGPVLASRGSRKAPVGTGAILSSSGPKTSNARGSQMPGILVDRNEALIRIGGAMYSGALQGNGIGAATQEYGKIQDADRAATEKQRALDQAKALKLAQMRAKGKGKGKGGPPSNVYKQATLSAITRIKDLLSSQSGFNPFDNVSGWTGSLLSSVPGTPAHDTLNSINTIEAAVGFDRLQKMRDDSPTGGALGQVTERELALLSQSLGSLKQSSSRAQFVDNLNAVEQHYQAAVAAVEAQQAEWYRMNGGTAPTNSTVVPSGGSQSTQSPSSDAVQAALDKYN